MNALCFFSLRPYVIFRQDSTISYMTSLHCGPVAPRLWAKRREGAPLDSKCTWTPPVITAQYFYPPSLHSLWQQLMQVEITHTLFYIVKTWQVGSLELCFNIKSPITIHLYIFIYLAVFSRHTEFGDHASTYWFHHGTVLRCLHCRPHTDALKAERLKLKYGSFHL